MTKSTIALALICSMPLSLRSQTSPSPPRPSNNLLPPYAIDDFPEIDRDALDTFFTAESAYRSGDYSTTENLLNRFWARYPAGSASWARAFSDADYLAKTTGLNFDAPVCYCALLMLSECVGWRMRALKNPTAASRPIQLTVVLVGHSSGMQPTSLKDLRANTGREAHHDLAPALNISAREIIDESLWLFLEYVRAMTGGRLNPRTQLLRPRNLDIPVYTTESPYTAAQPNSGSLARIWQAVGKDITASTDWWWILYPSHVPEQYPDFTDTPFITGGMTFAPGGAPVFLLDDRSLLRKRSYMGYGLRNSEERRAWLPHWFQHEFFHYVYQLYPELRLEVTGHQWFDRKTWPSDFQGLLEPDYYAESLHKRLESVTPPLHVALRRAAPPSELFLKLTVNNLAGRYRRDPVESNYHQGVIQAGPLRWRNDAGGSWSLTPDLANGVLLTGPDNPHYDSESGHTFRIVLRRGPDGDYLPEVAGFQFNGELYNREGK